jgi:phage tail-like protein
MADDKTAGRRDPLPVFLFRIKLDGMDEASSGFFKSVSGLRYETEVIPVKEGGANDTTFNLVGATKWSNIVLKQGFSGDPALIKWREEWITGTYTRRDGVIQQLYGPSLEVKASWRFFKGWPCKWEISEFDASKSELAIETLEIAHNGIKFGG